MKKLIGVVSLAACLTTAALAKPIDHKMWDTILRANVDDKGFVNYFGIRTNKGGDLYQYLSFVEVADVKDLSEPEKMAFWINAYNAHVIRLILAHPDMKKVDEDLGLFDQKFKIAKVNFSLNNIEHRILRLDVKKGGPIEGYSVKELDPRVHFALVCGAIDCPKLSNHAYFGNSVDQQLQTAALNFANNPKHIRIENGKLIVSSLMKWYGEDFEKAGGPAAYLTSLIDPEQRPDGEEIILKLKSDFPSNVDFQYDWTLNDVKNKK